MKRFIAFIILCSVSMCTVGDSPDALYQQGVEKLRQSQSDHSALVPAIRLLAKAANLFDAQGNEAKSAEVMSCLYWARKKLTLADTNVLQGSSEVTQKLEAIVKPVESSEAQKWLDRADLFAQRHAHDPLLVAIQYFSVGDRFKDTDIGREAIELSLKYMQQIGEKTRLAEYKATATDGKAFIQSHPPGAIIILVDRNGRRDLGKRTPSIIQLPKGNQTLSLELSGMKPASVNVYVTDAIAKPASAKLEPVMASIDVLFEEGWLVFLNGKPLNNDTGRQAMTPCSVKAPFGIHTMALAKEGYWDISQRVDVKDTNLTIEIKQKGNKGTSGLLTAAKNSAVSGASRPGIIDLLKLFDKEKDVFRGNCELRNGSLVCDGTNGTVDFPYHPPEEYDFHASFEATGTICRPVIMLVVKSKAIFLGLGIPNESFRISGVTKLQQGKKYEVIVQVRNGAAKAFLDGKLLGSTGHLNSNSYWTSRDQSSIAIGTHESAARFDRIEIIEVSGPGKKTR